MRVSLLDNSPAGTFTAWNQICLPISDGVMGKVKYTVPPLFASNLGKDDIGLVRSTVPNCVFVGPSPLKLYPINTGVDCAAPAMLNRASCPATKSFINNSKLVELDPIRSPSVSQIKILSVLL